MAGFDYKEMTRKLKQAIYEMQFMRLSNTETGRKIISEGRVFSPTRLEKYKIRCEAQIMRSK